MAKPEWGKKRTCPECETRFYDLNAEEVKCPSCGHVINPNEVWKMSKTTTKVTAKKNKKSAANIDEIDDIFQGDIDAGFDGDEHGKDDELDILEDASDLGDDDTDVAGVIDTKPSKGFE